MRKEIPILLSTEMVQATSAGRKTKTRRTSGLDKVNEEPDGVEFCGLHTFPDGSLRAVFHQFDSTVLQSVKCPYGHLGDVLYVRENWKMKMWDFEDREARIGFVDGQEITFEAPEDDKAYEWIVKQFQKLYDKGVIRHSDENEEMMVFTDKPHPFSPSIHLPKWCSRIWLLVTGIGVERLWDITGLDCCAEGIEFHVPIPGDGMTQYKNYMGPEKTTINARRSFSSLWEKINGIESWEANPWVWVVSFQVLSTTGRWAMEANLEAIETQKIEGAIAL